MVSSVHRTKYIDVISIRYEVFCCYYLYSVVIPRVLAHTVCVCRFVLYWWLCYAFSWTHTERGDEGDPFNGGA